MQRCDIGDVKSICELAGRSPVGSGTLLLVGARLGSQTLAMLGEWMRFQALSNEVAGVNDAGSYRSCGC